jgi:hypothetical protein
MKEHALFPTLLCEFTYTRKDHFKELMFDKIMNYISPEGISDESTGHVNLHHEPLFDDFYAFAVRSAKQYVNRLHIDTDRFDFNLTKSWFNLKDQAASPVHGHEDSHVSFAYYINVPREKNHSIRFYDHKKHQPYHDSIKWNNTSNTWDEFNALTWSIVPEEGQLLVFPSSLQHDTTGELFLDEKFYTIEKLRNSRICLAGDILLTYKEKTATSLGLQPIRNWRRYEP